MLTQGFSQALQILKDTYLKVDEAVPQPKPADSLQTCSLSLELPTPLNKPKKHCKQDTKKTEQNNQFFHSKKSCHNYAFNSEKLYGKANKSKFI